MRTVKLGRSGLEVSELGLGCYGFGDPGRGTERWTVGPDEARTVLRAAADAGVTFFDTANVYSGGHSEEILGRAVAEFGNRDELVVATKVWARTRPGANGAGLSRKAILAEIDNSLRRLGLDHVDLYQIHRFDESTPVEETMQALHDVVTAGKARYIGASSMPAWQFGKLQNVAGSRGTTAFVSMQNQYNLLYREEEREMIPYCIDAGIGVIPWSPLARGVLARPWGERTARADQDRFVDSLYSDADEAIVDRVGEIARARGVPRAQVALAWLRHQPGVTAPIVGATGLPQLDDAIRSLELTLDAGELARLSAGYRPRPVDNG